jgi:hypothetical protein
VSIFERDDPIGLCSKGHDDNRHGGFRRGPETQLRKQTSDARGQRRAGHHARPVLAVKGTTHFRSPPNPKLKTLGWDNYSSTCIDPLDSTLIWTCQEYANSTVESEWYTAWAAFRLGDNKKTPSDR